jgi:hypothetical protein
MGLKFVVTVDGEQQAANRFTLIGRRARDARPAFREISRLIYESEQRRFNSRSGWAPLAASTVARKRREGLSPQIMRATGALHRALTVPGDPSILDIDKDRMRFGLKGGRTAVYYGRFHQQGKGVPKRPVVVFTAATRRNANRILTDHFAGR